MTVATDQPVDDRYLASGREAGTAPGDRRFRPDVQGLRAVAVLLVVLFHAGWQPVGWRLRRGRRVLRHLRVRHHRSAPAGTVIVGSDLDPRLLRAALPPDHPGGDAGHPGHGHPGLRRARRRLRGPDRHRRAVGGGVPGQLPLRLGRHQLPERPAASVAAPELLVAGRRGAVLPRLPDLLRPGGHHSLEALAPSPAGRRALRDHRRLLHSSPSSRPARVRPWPSSRPSPGPGSWPSGPWWP